MPAGSPKPFVTDLCARLRRALGPDVVFEPVSRPGARLAVTVVAGTRVDTARFQRWARQARLPAVVVETDGETTYVGPLSEPGRAGCGECGRRRRLSAAADNARTTISHADGPALLQPSRAAAGHAPPQPGAIRPLFPRYARSILSSSGTSRPVDNSDVEATTRVSGALIAGVDDPTAVVGNSVIHPDHDARADDPTTVVANSAINPDHDTVVALLRDPTQLRDHLAEVRDGNTTWHRVIPLPNCPVCGGPNGTGTTTLPDDPTELLEALAGWVDPLTGVIPWVSVHRPLPGGAYVATAAPTHNGRRLPTAWGNGMDEATAIRSAVGEAIERYAASLPDPARLRWARPADLDGDVLEPRELSESDQYARTAFDRRADHPWVRGTWLDNGRPVWVPAALAYLLPEHHICQSTTNGLAAGPDVESATVSAVLELVERDAMLAAWFIGARGRYIDLDDTLDADLADAVDALIDEGHTVEVHLLPTSTYGATALALALGDGERLPGIAIGIGAARDPRAAMRRALLELAQRAPHLTTLRPAVPERPEDVRVPLDHAAYYFRPDRVVAFDRLRCGGTTRLSDLPETGAPASTDDLAGVLGAAGIRVAIVDVTSADVATGPFRVVRAVSAALQPLGYGHGNDRAPVPRLRPRLLPAHRRPIHPIW